MIDKNELIDEIRYSSTYNAPCPEWVYEKIDVTPEAITRCKDCRYMAQPTTCTDKKYCEFLELWIYPDDFCKWGKKTEA